MPVCTGDSLTRDGMRQLRKDAQLAQTQAHMHARTHARRSKSQQVIGNTTHNVVLV